MALICDSIGKALLCRCVLGGRATGDGWSSLCCTNSPRPSSQAVAQETDGRLFKSSRTLLARTSGVKGF
jgi:hypothetical protein